MYIRSSRFAAFAVIAALPTLLPVGTSFAAEYARMENVPIIAARPDGAPPVASAQGLLTLPSTWRPGGAAAVLVTDRTDRQGGEHARLVADLIGGGVAVLELLLPDQAEARLPILFGALHHLSREAGAGRVIALGTRAAEDAMIQAGAPGAAATYVGAGGPRFALLAALRPGCPVGPDVASAMPQVAGAGLASGAGGVSCLNEFARAPN